jgi:hypothetical protein
VPSSLVLVVVSVTCGRSLSAFRARSRRMAASAVIKTVPITPASAISATDCSSEIGTPKATTVATTAWTTAATCAFVASGSDISLPSMGHLLRPLVATIV